MLTVDLDRAIHLIMAVVKNFGPDHLAGTKGNRKNEGVPGCIYVTSEDDGYTLVPVCIVGQVFANLGILRALVMVDGVTDPHEISTPGEGIKQFAACTPHAVLWERAAQHGVTFTHEAQEFLRDVQSAQDGGDSWGLAMTTGLNMAQARVKQDHPAFTNERFVRALAESSGIDPLPEWEKELLYS